MHGDSSTPTRKFLTAQWRYLVMLNYEIDPSIVKPLVPRGTELDLWQGRALVSIVGFRFLSTRLCGVCIPYHRNFDEVNLRFYVRRRYGNEWRRGVVFIREIVPQSTIATVARALYNEPYIACPMRHKIQMSNALQGGKGAACYQWFTNRWHTLKAVTTGAPIRPAPESEEEFITEHYWGYTQQRDGSTLEYKVTHPRWRVWQTTASRFDCDVTIMYGSQYGEPLGATPRSAFVAEGSQVAVYRGVRFQPD